MNTFTLSLDLDKEQGLPQLVTLRQGDKSGTQLVATIYDHGQLVSGSYTARVSLRHPGTGATYYRETATYSNGVATVTVDEQRAATVAGVTTGYFELLQGSSVKASTADFIVRILPSAEDGAVPGEVYDSAIEDALDELDAATGRISQMVVDATAEYLAAHPEITTTVQDNSVTDAKLIQSGGVLDRVGRLWWRLENLLTNTPAEAESVTVADAAKTPVAGLTVFGKSTQDGTPTPDAPVAIESVEAPNLVDYVNGYTAGQVRLDGDRLVNLVTDSKTFTAPIVQTFLDGTYTGDIYYISNYNVTQAGTYSRAFTTIHEFNQIRIKHNGTTHDIIFLTQNVDAKLGDTFYVTITLDETNPSVVGGLVVRDIALYKGRGAKPYAPKGCIGLATSGKNVFAAGLFPMSIMANGVTWTLNEDGSLSAKGTATSISQTYWTLPESCLPSLEGKVLCGSPSISGCSVRLERTSTPYTSYAADTGSGATIAFPTEGPSEANLICRVDTGKTVDVTFHPMIRPAGTSAAYEPYTESVTAIPLDGHTLRSLPDGTRDEVTVDQYGHVTLVERVGYADTQMLASVINSVASLTSYVRIGSRALSDAPSPSAASANTGYCNVLPFTGAGYGTDAAHCYTNARDAYIFAPIGDKTTWNTTTAAEWIEEHNVEIVYPLATPVTHDLGTIDPTALVGPDLTAQAVPTAPFALTYERDLNATLARLEAAIAEVATS